MAFMKMYNLNQIQINNFFIHYYYCNYYYIKNAIFSILFLFQTEIHYICLILAEFITFKASKLIH